MLIESDRITENDLKIWKKYEQMDSINSVSITKIMHTVELIKNFTDNNLCYCSISWGKDSVVLAHLCLQMQIPYIWIKEKEDFNPECLKVRDCFLIKYCVEYIEIECESQLAFDKTAPFFKKCEEIQKKYGKRITGIRNDESGRRLLRFKKHGFETLNTLCPLSRWTNREIFSYLYHNQLPVNPIYAMLNGGLFKRESLRTDIIGGLEGNGMGRTQWEKIYFPDILNRLSGIKK